MNHWSLAENVSRTGASHLRRGVVCQDASGHRSLLDRSGQPVQVMAVADGHGGQRYTRSDVGSRLACEVAFTLLAAQFSQWSCANQAELQRWRSWLQTTFPRSLHQKWMKAVERHWQEESTELDALEQPFTPLAYGTTIGVVIMTPTWWGHTGLGDWDLVRVDPSGDVTLINEEQDEAQTSGEATYSLCLSNAYAHFGARTTVYPIAEGSPDFSLFLSTDGVRKSCSTDEDFYEIAMYLCRGERPRSSKEAKELDADLDRISSQGSGDDVSVAICRWRGPDKSLSKSAAPRRNQQLQRNDQAIVNPQGMNLDRGLHASDPVGVGMSGHSASTAQSSKGNGSSHNHLWLLTRGLFLLSTIGLICFIILKRSEDNTVGKAGVSTETTTKLTMVLQQEVDSLCDLNQPTMPNRDLDKKPFIGLSNLEGETKHATKSRDKQFSNSLLSSAEDRQPTDPQTSNKQNRFVDLITARLNQRKSIFKGLLDQSKSRNSYLNKPSRDPLGTLIAWHLPDAGRQKESKASLKHAADLCPELRQALSVQWEQAKEEQQLSRFQGVEDTKNALLSINSLYQALSAKDFKKAGGFYSKSTKDQFTPRFFEQFAEVIVEQLKTISNRRRVLEMQGLVTFTWPDGTEQIEKRYFVVDTNQPIPIIIASEFVSIIETRERSKATRRQGNKE